MTEITVFTAARIVTMNPPLPTATAVAVRDGLIVEVGSLETMAPWLDAHACRIDERFADLVLMPGFIDPHLHPSMAAVLLPMHFITAMEWRLPWQTFAAVRGAPKCSARLAAARALGSQAAASPAISRAVLTRVSAGTTALTRPISRASSAEITRAVSTSSRAFALPTIFGSRWVLPSPGSRPSLVNVKPSLAVSAAMRMSQGSVIVTPTPIAAPLIEAITGLGKLASSSGKRRTKSSSPSFGPGAPPPAA